MSQDSIIVEPSAPADPIAVPVTTTTVPPAKSALEAITLPNDDSIDPTYRGKSAKDLIEMHKNAASTVGRQGQELGVWRGLVAELSTAARQAPATETKAAPKITSDALLTNPTESISSVIRHELDAALKPIKDARVTDQREAELAALNRDFPNYGQTGDDPEFQKWANSARGRAADAAAVQRGDTSAARRLLEAWEDRKALAESFKPATTTTDTGKPQGVTGARTATTEAGGGGRTQATGKIMNRAEIVQLIIDKPDVYNSDAYQAELLQAAKEGRIR